MRTSLPIIAVTQRVQVTEHSERRDALDQRWHDVITELGALPLAVPNNAGVAAKLLRQLRPAGVVLTGGNDLLAYGGDAPERDETEHAVLEHAAEHRLPLLGVCRGMQLLLHQTGTELQRVKGHVTPRMVIDVAGEQVGVNSYHHLAALDVRGPWRVWARSEDGVVKAVAHRERNWVGVMWHPEREAALRPRDLQMLRTLFEGEGELQCVG